MAKGMKEKVVCGVRRILLPLLCVGCGPIKGYPGPELPASRLVTITPQSSDRVTFLRSWVDDTSFKNCSIQVLPGQHTINVRYSARRESRNCGVDHLYDDFPSQRLANEERCRKQNPDNPSGCSSLWMLEPVELKCDYLRTEYECLLRASLPEPGVYTLQVHATGEMLELSGYQTTLRFDCHAGNSSWQREKMG